MFVSLAHIYSINALKYIIQNERGNNDALKIILFDIYHDITTYMQRSHRSRLNPSDPNSVLVDNVRVLYVVCKQNWEWGPRAQRGIYSAFLHTVKEAYMSVLYRDVRGGGVWCLDFDRTKTDAEKTKRCIDETLAEWIKLSVSDRSKFPDVEERVNILYAVPDYNPPSTGPPAPVDNPAAVYTLTNRDGHSRHTRTNPADPNATDAQLVNMMMRVRHSMR